MTSPPVIDALRKLVTPNSDQSSDAELLTRYLNTRDQAAFAALVRRYSPLVWGACRRRINDAHLAEDAFQTTFLALARHAATIRQPSAIGAWLHRAAVRCTAAIRPQRDFMSSTLQDVSARGPDPSEAASARDLEQAIDSEIDALPEPFRQAFVLCEVQQRTAIDAAETIGCPVGTVESRLARARHRLRERLTRRGLTVGVVSGVSLAVESVPANARDGAIGMATGSTDVPVGWAALADRVANPSFGMVKVGLAVTGALGAAGVGCLIWAMVQSPAVSRPNGTPPAVASADLPIPEPEEFRRNALNYPLPPEAIARVGEPWLRHASIARSMAYSGDGKYLATGAPGDRWLRVWDLSEAKPRAHLMLWPNEEPLALSLSADGLTLTAIVRIGAEQSPQLREYNTFRGIETRRRLVAGGTVDTAAFTSDGRQVALASNGRVRLHDADSLAERWRTTVGTGAEKVELAFAGGGSRLAVVPAKSERVSVFDVTTGRLDGELTDTGVLSTPTFSNDGKRLAAWSAEAKCIRVWDVRERKIVHSIEPRYALCSLAFSPEGDAVVGFSKNSPAVRWPLREGAKAHLFRDVFGGFHGRFSPDGTVLAVATESGTVQLLDTRDAESLPSSPKHVLTPVAVDFRANGKRLLVENFQSWEEYPLESEGVARLVSPGIGPHEKVIKSAGDRAAVSPDGSVVARCTAGELPGEYGLDLLDATTGNVLRRIEIGQRIRRLTFSPNGHMLYAIAADGLVHGWDTCSGTEVMRTTEASTGYVSRLVVSPSGSRVATAQTVFTSQGNTESIRVFSAATGEKLFTANGIAGEPRIAFSSDARWFAAAVTADGVPHEVRVWDATSGHVRATLKGYNGQPAFSPDARTLAVTLDNGVVLMELATGDARHVFQHHGKIEPALAWRGDGRVIAAASPEAPVYLWDVVGNRTGSTGKWDPTRDEVRWSALTGTNAPEAFQSLRQLWANPEHAVSFLKNRVTAMVAAPLASRACEGLELIATTEAKELLSSWSSGPEESPLTREARDSLRRLKGPRG
jgi:RNA polymerase sigma factor (sigma-70 family)